MAVALVCSLTLFVGPLRAAPEHAHGLRARLLETINRSRAAHGLKPLKLNVVLSGDARRHTRRMVDARRLFHSSNVPGELRPWHWSAWGENVGCSTSLAGLHRAFMQSAVHRANILNRTFRRVGLGVLRSSGPGPCAGGDQVWATEILYG